jgi:MYXO-CTERM domain-containing protein
MRPRYAALAALLTGAGMLAAPLARAQCDAGDGGDPIDLGALRDSFPADQGFDVPTDSPVRLRFVGRVPSGATLCVEPVGTPGCLPGAVSVVGDELVWSSAGARPFDPYASYRVNYSDPLTGALSLRFRTGRGPSAGPPPFAGIRGASARAVSSDPCDPNAYDIYSTRGPGVSGPRERDRARLQSSGSTSDAVAQRTFRLSSSDASGPVCFSVQALDPLGRSITNSAEECVNPAEGNYFQGCSTTPGSHRGAAGWAAFVMLGLFAGRRRQRALVSARRTTVGSAPS